ncbi:MAG: tetratricopeptide repeat protein [Lachnospiraceae bacterium]
MANQKFKVLSIINHSEWLRSCPVFIVRSQIILNNENNKLFIVNEMANVGQKGIKDVIIKMLCQSEDGTLISEIDNCVYQGVNVEKQAVFGGNKLFGIPDGTQKVQIVIKSITYADQTTWKNDFELKGIKIDNPVRIDPNDSVIDVVNARCKENNVAPKFWPYEFDGGWRCTCAQLNDEEDLVCGLCGASKFWILDNLNREDIIDYKERTAREARLRAEREAEEARLAAEREAEERRLEEERIAEEKRLEEERIAEEARRAEEEKRIAEARAAEEARLAAEREAEERRLAEERAAEEARRAEEERRLAEERAAEEARLAEIRAIEEAKRAEEERKAAEERARLEILMAKKEAVRQYNMKQTRKSAKKGVFIAGICVLLVVLAFGAYQLVQIIRVNDRYENAKKSAANFNYDEAIKTYRSLGDYKDSAQMVLQTKYEYAEYLTALGNYQSAIDMYTELGSYQDSSSKISQVYYKWGKTLKDEGQFDKAFEYFDKAGSLVSEEEYNEITLEYADYLINNGDYAAGIDVLKNLDDMSGIETKIKDCYYQWGKTYLDQSRFDDAIETLRKSYNTAEVKELIKKAYYQKGNKALTAKDIELAYDCYVSAGDYEDADAKEKSLYPDMAELKMNQKNYNAAAFFYANMGETEEAEAGYNKAKYMYAESMIQKNIDETILDIYKNLPKNYENSKQRIAMIEKYIKYIGKYTCTDEKAEIKTVSVKMTIVDDQVEIKVNGEPINSTSMSSDTCIINKDTVKLKNPDGTLYTYKK